MAKQSVEDFENVGTIEIHRITDSSERITGIEELIFRAALLAGLGSYARTIADELIAEGIYTSNSRGTLRTCVDAGSRMIFSVLAPGGRNLRVLVRIPPALEGVCRWLRVSQKAGENPERWEMETFMRVYGDVWRHAINLAGAVGGGDTLHRYHSVLGPMGRIFSTSRLLTEGAHGGWVTWQLDRYRTPQEALDACGIKGVWPIVAGLFKMLLGRHVSGSSRPWSISWNLDPENPRLRIGSTIWTRQSEERGKCRRMVSTVEHLGGDGRFAEGLYKMLGTSLSSIPGSRIGRAAEVEILGGQVTAMEFYMCTVQKLDVNE